MENQRKFLVEVTIKNPMKFNEEIGGPIDDDASMEMTIESVMESYLFKKGLHCTVIKETTEE